MAENEQIVNDQPANPAPEPQATPAPQPAELNLDSKVTFDGKEVSVGDLINQNRKISELEEYKTKASALMSGEVSQEERENAMRYILGQQGYSSNQIETYISSTKEMANQMTEETPSQQPNPTEEMLAQERARIAEMEARQSRMGVDMLRRDMDSALESTMQNNPKINALLQKSKDLVGEEGYEKRVMNIQEQIRQATMANLQSRKSRGERFDSSWFNQETDNAANAVYERIRSVIGDPDKIQRAPETASDVESFISKPPVAAPTYERGDNMGSATDKSHDFTVDALSRLAADLGMGGESRI